MRILILLSIFLVQFTVAQQNENSLLWEISGNQLQHPSYLYGTMHVSNKIAFRLDDIFFKALNQSEVIALESDPSKWLDHTYKTLTLKSQNNDYNYRNNFYDNLFQLKSPREDFVRNSIKFDNRLINGYLYRKNSITDNFEEETYLDLFIYQAGKKHHKDIVGLEDIEESRYLTTKAQYNSRKKKIDDWLLKRFKESNSKTLMEDAYRDRNIALIDSIGQATNTTFFRAYMLFKRNENMVSVLDSLMHKKTVFAGVGAAHLYGEKGMIGMLRDKGYTLKPLKSEQTSFSEIEKEKLNETFVAPKLIVSATPDNFITLKSFDSLREFNYKNNKYYIAPNMTNGAYLSINRISTYEYLPKNKTITLEKIDHLLFEDIPGKIIKKEQIVKPYPGISILNVTKKGDYQKYHIYKTPLEIIVIKFAGKKDFVLKYGDKIFNSIQLKPIHDNTINYKSIRGNYSFTMPEHAINENALNIGKKIYQSKDKFNYYFLQETPVHNTTYIEEDEFEAKFIVENFFDNIDLKAEQIKPIKSPYKSYQAEAIIDSLAQTKLFLKSVIKDESYYLMGMIGKDATVANTFFNSLKFHNTNYSNFTKVKDTSLHFTVTTNTKPPLPFSSYFNKRKKKYESVTNYATYQTKANEKISITRTKYHDLQMFENIDSLWNSFNDKKSSLIKYNSKKWKDTSGYYYTYKLKDTNSLKQILVKHIQKKGTLFTLKTLVDSIEQPSQFITKFYKTFKPVDTLLGENIFNDKTEIFFNALKNNDSLVLKGYTKLKFNNEHVNTLIYVIRDNHFSDDKKQIKLHLIKELGKIKAPKANLFLKQLYIKSYSNPSVQAQILKVFLDHKDFEEVSKLLAIDMPLNLKRTKIFNPKTKALSDYTELFPKILEYTSVNEYKLPLYKLLSRLKDSAYIKPKLYKKYKSQIIKDGKIEIKRSLNLKNNSTFNDSNLSSYVSLIFPYRKEKAASSFFTVLLKSKNSKALSRYLILLYKNNETIPNQLLQQVVYNEERLAVLVKEAETNRKFLSFLNTKISQQDYAKSLIITKAKLKTGIDSLEFYTHKKVITDDNKNIDVYFYKATKNSIYRKRNLIHFIAFKNNENALQPKVFFRSKKYGTYINDSETIDEHVEKAIKLIKHKKRKRINKKTFY